MTSDDRVSVPTLPFSAGMRDTVWRTTSATTQVAMAKYPPPSWKTSNEIGIESAAAMTIPATTATNGLTPSSEARATSEYAPMPTNACCPIEIMPA